MCRRECKCASEVRLAADLRVRMWKWGMVANYDIISLDSANTFDFNLIVNSLSSKEAYRTDEGGLPLRRMRSGVGGEARMFGVMEFG